MTDQKIYTIAKRFKKAIENARDDNRFNGDAFEHFPRGCCGDTSYLLAEYLLTKGQESIYVWGEDITGQTHAWLILKDDRITQPTSDYFEFPDDIKSVMSVYGNDRCDAPIDISHYEECNVMNGLYIDITADQFGESPVYVGFYCDFYHNFEFQAAHDYTDLGSGRLRNIYRIIQTYL